MGGDQSERGMGGRRREWGTEEGGREEGWEYESRITERAERGAGGESKRGGEREKGWAEVGGRSSAGHESEEGEGGRGSAGSGERRVAVGWGGSFPCGKRSERGGEESGKRVGVGTWVAETGGPPSGGGWNDFGLGTWGGARRGGESSMAGFRVRGTEGFGGGLSWVAGVNGHGRGR